MMRKRRCDAFFDGVAKTRSNCYARPMRCGNISRWIIHYQSPIIDQPSRQDERSAMDS